MEPDETQAKAPNGATVVLVARCRRNYCRRSAAGDHHESLLQGLASLAIDLRRSAANTQTVLEFLSAGDSIEDVLDEYPALSREYVLACLAYSAQLMN